MTKDTARLGVDQEGSTASTTDDGQATVCVGGNLARFTRPVRPTYHCGESGCACAVATGGAVEEVARLNNVIGLHLLDERLLSWVGTDDSRMVAVLSEMYPTEKGTGAVGPLDPDRPVCSLRTAIQRAASAAAKRGTPL